MQPLLGRRRLMDTVGMIAYRALVGIFAQLKEMEIVVPATDLTLSYRFVGDSVPLPAEPAPEPAASVNPSSQR